MDKMAKQYRIETQTLQEQFTAEKNAMEAKLVCTIVHEVTEGRH
jgi:hypothetical protein